MNTPFGKWIGKHMFGKLLPITLLVGVLGGTLLNGQAAAALTHSLWLSGAVAALYAVAGVLTLWQQRITETWLSRRLERIMGISSCFFLYDFMILLLWWMLAVCFSFSEREKAIGVFCSDGLAVVIVFMGYWHTRQIRCTSYAIDLGRKGQPYRIALLSDLHLGAFVGERHMRHVVDRVNRLAADVVVICGDIIDVNNHILRDKAALAKISAVFQNMYAKEGIFAVLGNHDPQADHEGFKKFLCDANICLLHNQTVSLSQINLVGRTNARHNIRRPLAELMGDIDPSKPTVVLDHDPCDIAESIAYGVDLVLCGHTHKGQFFPITWLTKRANGKHYFYGQERFGSTQVVISSGAGFFSLPVRIGTSNEIVDLVLT